MSSVLKQITVAEVMSINIYTISPERTVAQAYGLMRVKRLGGLPVIENGNLVGIVTHNYAKGVKFRDRAKTKVRDIMTKQVVTILPDEKVSTALERMSELRIGRMPVVSKTGALVGFLARSDIDKASKTLRYRNLNSPESIKCPRCSAPLPITLNRVAVCEHCRETVSL